MKITVFGSGYVGLVTGACLADVGHEVMCVDIDTEKVEKLRKGIIPIYEPGLEEMVAHNFASGRLHFTNSAKEGVDFGLIQFIAVGTPPDEDGSADLKYVLAVARDIGRHMSSYKVIVDKSTVPVGTAERVHAEILSCLKERGIDIDFDVCSNPEFLKEGAAIEDFTKGARIVVGTESLKARHLMTECYAPYNRNHEKLIFMKIRAAELTKYAANAILATKISFMNEIANLAERMGADIEEVRKGIGSDPRIGYHFIYPGCGYGGSCFPKDVRALNHSAAQVGYDAQLLQAVEAVNDRQKGILYQKLINAFGGNLNGKTIAIWGLAFKPDTDDMRDAPSRALMEALWDTGAKVQAYDPEAMNECRRIYGSQKGLQLAASRESAISGADALVICTEWKEFRTIDFNWLRTQLKFPVVIDGRNLYEPSIPESAGIMYFGVGRGRSLNQSTI